MNTVASRFDRSQSTAAIIEQIQFYLDNPSLDLPLLNRDDESLTQLTADIEACRQLLLDAGKQPIEVLGAGSFGIVFRAFDESLKREVALKIMRPSTVTSHRNMARFTFEAESLARCECEGILPIYDYGVVSGLPYLTMQLVQGSSLAVYLQSRGTLPDRTAAELMRQVAMAVYNMHNRGFIHRDLKPSNILLAQAGPTTEVAAQHGLAYRPFVTDFGFAKEIEEGLADHSEEHAIVGTVKYMAPEQARGRRDQIAVHTDIYALGVVLYEMVTSHTPHHASSKLELLSLIVGQPPTEPRDHNPDLSRELEAIILRCLNKEPASRYASAKELAEDLQRFLNHQPTVARPAGPFRKLVLAARRNPLLTTIWFVLLIALMATGWFYHRSQNLVVALESSNNRLAQKNAELIKAQKLSEEFIQFASKAYREGIQQYAEFLSLFVGGGKKRLELHESAVEFFKRLADAVDYNPFSRHQLSIAYHFLADAQSINNQPEPALENRLKCIDLLRTLANEAPDNAILHNDLFNNLRQLGYQQPQQQMELWAEARAHIDKAIELQPANSDWSDARNCILYDLAEANQARGEFDQARQLAQDAIKSSSELWQRYPDKPLYRKYVSLGHKTLGTIASQEGQLDDMRNHFEEAIQGQRFLANRRANLGTMACEEAEVRLAYITALQSHQLDDLLAQQVRSTLPVIARAIAEAPQSPHWATERTRLNELLQSLKQK